MTTIDGRHQDLGETAERPRLYVGDEGGAGKGAGKVCPQRRRDGEQVMAATAGTVESPADTPISLQLPGIILGVGLGGFVDGILLHQLLQWHHMLTSTNHDRIGARYYNPHTVSGLEMNTLWDGIFHAVCWIAVLTGLAALYSRVSHNRRAAWTGLAPES